ncbi:MAG: TetR family transcriptional regulator, partial [Nevskiales bacterium]
AVAKRAGVSPTAFYRHFPDMEELGLAMLDDIGHMLRRMLREVRKVSSDPQKIVGGSMLTFFAFVRENRSKFVVLGRERVGGSPRMRAAIRNQMSFFSNELASDIQLMGAFPEMSHNDHLRLAAMIIQLAVGAVPDILDLPDQPEAEQDLRITMEKQALLILLGAVNWNKKEEANKDEKTRKRRR